MQATNGELILSASDVVGFSSCGHRTAQDRKVALGLVRRPVRDDPMGSLLAGQGNNHETAMVERFRAEGRSMVELSWAAPGATGLAAAVEVTAEAMRSGVEVIHRAAFFDPPWRGHADFLLRVETPSVLGSWSYEVADAKLHRKARTSDWLQIAFYSDRLAALQGVIPLQGHLLLGDGATVTGLIAEHLDTVHDIQAALVGALAAASDPPPEPNPACAFCQWEPECRRVWQEQGHLSVLGFDRRIRTRFAAAGIATVGVLADITDIDSVPGVEADTVRRLRSDARLWLQEQRSGIPHVRLRYPRDGKGLDLLPTPADGDVFFDLEGYGMGSSPHREYLWGAMQRRRGTDGYRSWWAHNADDEVAAFSAAVRFFEEVIGDDPDCRVYHYNNYEATAMRRLAERVGGNLGDRALRLVDTVFVDLLPIARWSVRTSSMSASLKALERFYRPGRAGGVIDGAGSMVAYDAWITDGDPERLQAIEAYNRDDCQSLADLRDWLVALAADVADARRPLDNDALREVAAIVDLQERLTAAAALPDGGPVLRRTLIALAFDDNLDAASVLGWTDSNIQAALLLGKKELGLPIAVSELALGRHPAS